MSSPTQGAWECRHGIDARDHCQRCISPPPPKWVVAVDDFQDNRIHLHSLLAQAWDEGFQAACDETLTGFGPEGPADERNPYVEEAMRWPR